MTVHRLGRERLRAALAVLAAIGVTAAIVAVLAGRGGGGTGPSTAATTSTVPRLSAADKADQGAARAWDARVADVFRPLVDATPRLLTALREWTAGTRPDDAVAAEVARDVAAFERVRDGLAGLPRLALAPAALDLYRDAALLYVEMARTDAVAVRTPPGAIRAQVDLLARRLRVLGDRVFDRGRALVEPFFHEPANPDLEVRRAEEVPDWVAEGMAAGPPLDDPPPPAAPEPPLSQAHRPSEPPSRWRAAVAAAAIPGPDRVRAAIDGSDPLAVRDVARALVAAAERLRREPDPARGREVSARARLALLVAADAARAAQLGLVGGGAVSATLPGAARRLALVSDAVWATVPDVAPRATGYDVHLLAEGATAPR